MIDAIIPALKGWKPYKSKLSTPIYKYRYYIYNNDNQKCFMYHSGRWEIYQYTGPVVNDGISVDWDELPLDMLVPFMRLMEND